MKKSQLYFALFVAAACILFLAQLPPIPQDPAYHRFADQRMYWGIPHFWDVASNLPLFFLGSFAFVRSIQHWQRRPDLVTRLIPLALSLGIFVAFFGSSYYHWAPENLTLVWDRLPMTLMFMPLLSLLVYDFLGKKAGQAAFWLLLPLGVFSVLYWHWTELQGQGDLRLYAFVQFFPMVFAPVMVLLSPGKVGYARYLWLVLAWYVAAKACEHFDAPIFEATGFWSGHTIKHFLGDLSLWYALLLVHGWRLAPAPALAD